MSSYYVSSRHESAVPGETSQSEPRAWQVRDQSGRSVTTPAFLVSSCTFTEVYPPQRVYVRRRQSGVPQTIFPPLIDVCRLRPLRDRTSAQSFHGRTGAAPGRRCRARHTKASLRTERCTPENCARRTKGGAKKSSGARNVASRECLRRRRDRRGGPDEKTHRRRNGAMSICMRAAHTHDTPHTPRRVPARPDGSQESRQRMLRMYVRMHTCSRTMTSSEGDDRLGGAGTQGRPRRGPASGRSKRRRGGQAGQRSERSG